MRTFFYLIFGNHFHDLVYFRTDNPTPVNLAEVYIDLGEVYINLAEIYKKQLTLAKLLSLQHPFTKQQT